MPQTRLLEPPSRANAEIVCFGMVIPAIVLAVDEFPEHNTGALVKQAAEFISDDAAIVACLLRAWNIRSGLIGTTLGDDVRGRRVARELRSLGVLGRMRFSRFLSTPYEVNVSDRTGQRTYFWQRHPEALETLDTAPLALLRGARMLYVDWYDGHHTLRPMEQAARWGIPVFLNLEHGHQDSDLLAQYAPRTAFCQAITDPAQREGDPIAVACKLLDAGVGCAFVTLGADGCIVARPGQRPRGFERGQRFRDPQRNQRFRDPQRNEILRAFAPSLPVVDGCGAGATFSAGILYGYLRHWNLEDTVKFATAAASLKCTVVGPRAFPLAQIKKLAKSVRVDYLAA